jgi:HD-like signal output (HDOD) protein
VSCVRLPVRQDAVSETTRKRILFVDDEPPVLNLLQTLFRHANPDWESCFTERPSRALALMDEEPFDVIVSDMRMPEMSGAQLLEQVSRRHPRTVRLVLSGYADQPMSVQALGHAHQYLSKPFTLTGLQSALNRIFAVRRFVSDPALQQALSSLHLLPSGPTIHQVFLRDIASPAVNSDQLGGSLAQDIALTAKSLQLVHSAFFGAPRPLTLAKDCAQALGVNLLRALTAAHRFALAPPEPAIAGLDLDTLNQHCIATGLRASRIMSSERATPDAVKIAFTSGVLHGIGRIALALSFPDHHVEVMRRVNAREASLLEAEQSVFGVTHACAGAYLLGLWGLPETIVDIVAHLHRPSGTQARFFGPLTAVHAASHFEGAALGLPAPQLHDLDGEYLEAVRVDQARLTSWAEASAPA